MSFDEHKVMLYRNQPENRVAEILDCYAWVPTREKALAEFTTVFWTISEKYDERKQPFPSNTTQNF